MADDNTSEWHQGLQYLENLNTIDKAFTEACYQVGMAKFSNQSIDVAYEGYEAEFNTVQLFYDMLYEWMTSKDMNKFNVLMDKCVNSISDIRKKINHSKNSGVPLVIPMEYSNSFREFMRELRKFRHSKGLTIKEKPQGF